MGACQCTSNRQEHKIIQHAGPGRDTIFYLRVTACRGRGSHGHDERLAWVASRRQGTSCSNSFVLKVLGANYKTANNFLPVAQKFTMCTDRKQSMNLTVMRINDDVTVHGREPKYRRTLMKALNLRTCSSMRVVDLCTQCGQY